MSESTRRLEQIAAMYADHHEQLRSVVRRRGSPDPDVVDDACQHAWTQLVACEHVDLGPPRWYALAWVTTTAVHHAWLLNRHGQRTAPIGASALEALAEPQPSSDAVAAERLRLDLVAQLPERPRRFLLRRAIGYSYDEISKAEGVSYAVTNKQLVRARRLLRALEHDT